MNDRELDNWVDGQRSNVEQHLTQQGIDDPTVGPWPAFEIAPHFAIWPVESKTTPGDVGWWAFSGDCPTDHVKEDGPCHPRHALTNLLRKWRTCIPYLKKGEQPPESNFTGDTDMATLAELLQTRVGILEELHGDEKLWENR
jgi:hypothetical protein